MASNARITLRGAVTSLALAALLVLPAAQAVAQAQTVTIKFKNTTETFPDVNPCTGDPGTLTLTYNGVLHMTQDATGGTHTTGTLTGTFSFDATDPALPDYSGRFTQWFGDNNNSNIDVATFTISVRGTGTDGSRLLFHGVAHITAETIDFSTDPPTVTGLRVSFDKFRCG
jgi:hypothetical protein